MQAATKRSPLKYRRKNHFGTQYRKTSPPQCYTPRRKWLYVMPCTITISVMCHLHSVVIPLSYCCPLHTVVICVTLAK